MSEAGSDRWPRLWELFDAARERAGGEERRRFLDQICAGEPDLRAELEQLLVAGDREDRLLDRDDRSWVTPLLAAPEPSSDQAPAGVPSCLGAWRLGRLLGEGGMGAVWAAERSEGGFTQRAAIKVLRAGAYSPALRERFLTERRILAGLAHPGIAHFLDGGFDGDGVPWFALELVEGVPLTTWCRTHEAGLERRLALFLEVCDAVGYAHRHLVVHRDLKPSNILVAEDGRVKLLDFGVAKLLPAPGEEVGAAAPTLLRAFTPEYAAPEQLEGGEITTATDVFALGLLLFELLAGRRPSSRTGSAGAPGATVPLTDTGERPSVAVLDVVRGPAGRAVARRLRGDLDRIVARASAREPARRYASVDALAQDVRAHLAGRPVSARGDSLGYRASRFARRHRVAVGAAAVAALALVGGLGAALWQARRAEREAARARAQAELAQASRDFLVSLFSSADPNLAQGRLRTDREMFAAGVERLEREHAGRPELQLPLLAEIASVYLQLGEYELAEPLAARVLEGESTRHGPASLEAARARRRLAEIRYQRNAFAEAAQLELAARAVLEASDLDADRRQVVESLAASAKCEFALGHYEAAASLLERALDGARRGFGAESPVALHVLTTRTSELLNSGRMAEGAASARETAELARRLEGPDAPATLTALLNEVVAESNLGHRERARALLAGLEGRLVRVLGPDHGETLLAIRLEARLAADDGDFATARAALGRVTATLRAAGQDQTLGYTLVQAANLARLAGDGAGAEALAREAVELFTRFAGPRHADTAFARSALGAALAARGALDEAARELAAASEIEVAGGFAGSDFHADTLERQGALELRRGASAAARRRLEEALALRRANSPAGSRGTGTTLVLLARAQEGAGREARCRELLDEAVALLARALGPEHPERIAAEGARAACGAPGVAAAG